MFGNKKAISLLYWLIIGIFVFLFLYLLVILFPLYGSLVSFVMQLLSPFLVSCLIAYLLYPVIKKLNSYNIPRSLAILMIYILFFGGAAYLIYRVYPVVMHQLHDLNEQLPVLIRMYESLIYQIYEYTSFLPETVHDKIDQLITRVEVGLENILDKLVGGFTRVFDMIVFLTVIPVLVFYFMKDYNSIKSYFKRFIPKKYQVQVSKLVYSIDESLGFYIRGQLIVSFFVSLASWIAFQYLDIKYALLLAIIMGLTNIIPYFGPIIGAIPVVGITLATSGELVIFVLIAIFAIQIMEGNLLSPYIVGKSINIHPIAIIFALLLGGQLFGVIGMIVAVPLLTIMNVITKHVMAIRQRDD
ncbi:putative PurR-regulated permease PerM [Virgibacillus natechei]|uniref:PurR-regulated permease PerM n=1 Tax=Virgibacillus natechei TaxID=1216297 RepID=A0ABS4ICT9_9BACI|nr:AI-2E family transporter [Virgibacillus natechei]MBP1968755.1 putative PurR-regulated permease PerM [Virgibacillus natechei]UZD11555.1 AI-2E family transporter [Virgibacillus natechei]